MNKKLKFSWGHIIAFLALIFISYVSYIGDFYQNGGNFKESIIKVVILNIALLATFIGAQIQKGTDVKFDKSIIIERVLFLLAPIVLIIAMIPNNHFWNVYNQKKQIEVLFNGSISESKKMFMEYDDYANKRISDYSEVLDNVIRRKSTDSKTYARSGFNGVNDHIRKGNYIHTLQLQLLSKNSIELQAEANKWLDKANKDVSVWNAFLIGNIEKISEAIKTWNKLLVEYSNPVLSNETLIGNEVSPFDSNKSSSELAINNLKSLTSIYRESGGINFRTILLFPVLIFMLILPYILQKRNTKAHGRYFLIQIKEKDEKPIIDHQDVYIKDTTTKEKEDDPFAGTF